MPLHESSITERNKGPSRPVKARAQICPRCEMAGLDEVYLDLTDEAGEVDKLACTLFEQIVLMRLQQSGDWAADRPEAGPLQDCSLALYLSLTLFSPSLPLSLSLSAPVRYESHSHCHSCCAVDIYKQKVASTGCIAQLRSRHIHRESTKPKDWEGFVASDAAPCTVLQFCPTGGPAKTWV